MELLVAAVQIAAVVVAAAALIVTLRGVRRQLWLSTFADYTKRYSEIVDEIPLAARLRPGSFSLAMLDGQERERVVCVAVRYLNLCSEEFHLHSEGIIDARTWRIWESEMKSFLERRWIAEAWVMIRAEYDSYPEFHSFVSGFVFSSEESSPQTTNQNAA
jgi:hypothetical protein